LQDMEELIRSLQAFDRLAKAGSRN
jgi:hypothetical protein